MLYETFKVSGEELFRGGTIPERNYSGEKLFGEEPFQGATIPESNYSKQKLFREEYSGEELSIQSIQN